VILRRQGLIPSEKPPFAENRWSLSTSIPASVVEKHHSASWQNAPQGVLTGGSRIASRWIVACALMVCSQVLTRCIVIGSIVDQVPPQRPTTKNFESSKHVAWVETVEAEIIRLLNMERLRHSLPPLEDHLGLSRAARLHSEGLLKRGMAALHSASWCDPKCRAEMLGVNSLGFGESTYETRGDRLNAQALARLCVENHVVNIRENRNTAMSLQYRYVGVGAAANKWRTIVTHIYTSTR